MKRVVKWCFGVFAVVGLCASAAAYALPGPQQAFWPAQNGLTEIAPFVFTDAPDRSAELKAMLATARGDVLAMFPKPLKPVRVILCTSDPCTRIHFRGRPPAGLTYGHHLILIAPQGVRRDILVHEFTHIELHRHIGLRDILNPQFPAWFDEGLASHISADNRLSIPDLATLTRIAQAQNFLDWSKLVREIGWREAYGGAQVLVSDFLSVAGTDGLQYLINETKTPEDFQRLFKLLGRS